MDVGGSFLAAGHVEVAAARRAGADEHGVIAFAEDLLHRVDALVAELDVADVGDVADFLVDHAIPASRKCGICVRMKPPSLGS